MIGRNFQFNGQTISTTTADFRIWLDVVQWKWLDVSDEQQNVQGYHGIKLSPTFARGRRVTLEGIILADDQEGSSKGIDYLESLFALQGIPDVVELLPFLVTDEQDRVWQLDCKIKEPLSIDIGDYDYLEWANRRWRVVLQSEDPRYYDVDESSTTGDEGHFGGIKLGAKLGFALNEEMNEIQVITTWNIQSPLKFTMTGLANIDGPLIIRNMTEGTFFGLTIDAVIGDIIIVDGINLTATKNGVNVLANRISWSTWPKCKWSNTFLVMDEDGGLFTSDFDISITWNNVIL